MRSFLHLVFMAWMVVSLSACWHDDDDSSGSGTDDSSGSGTEVPLNLQGQWAYVDSGEKVWLGARTNLDYTQIDDNLLQHTSQGNTYHLIRAGIQNVQVQGSVKALGSVNPAFKYLPKASADYPLQANGAGGIAGINVILTNVQDQSTRLETVTDSFGDFGGQIPSGSYEFSATDDTGNTATAQVTVEDESKDLGEFTLVPGSLYNFKSEIYDEFFYHQDNDFLDTTDDDFFYFGSKDGQDEIIYSKILLVQNIGDQTVSGLSFTLSMNDPDVRSFSYDNILGGMGPGQVIGIPISMSFRRPAADKELSIDVSIRDIQNRTWSDHASLTLSSQIPVELNITSKTDNSGFLSGVTGYVVTPGRTLKQVIQNGSVTVPYVPGAEYEVVFSNPSIETESAYGLGFGIALSQSVFDSFTETGRNEPDNTSATATNLSLYDSMVAYTHVGDVDNFRLQFDSSNTPFDPTLVGAVDIPGTYGAYVSVAISGNHAYVTGDDSLTGHSLQVVDISDPAQPGIVGAVAIPGNVYGVAISGNYAYVTSGYGGALQVVDISDPAQPGIVGAVAIPELGTVWDMAITGNYAYLAGSGVGLQVVDISVPAQPSLVGAMSIEVHVGAAAIAGNYAYMTGYDSLYVADFSNPAQPVNISIVGNVGVDALYNIAISGNYAYILDVHSLIIIQLK